GIPGRIQNHFSSTGPVELAPLRAPRNRRVRSWKTTWGPPRHESRGQIGRLRPSAQQAARVEQTLAFQVCLGQAVNLRLRRGQRLSDWYLAVKRLPDRAGKNRFPLVQCQVRRRREDRSVAKRVKIDGGRSWQVLRREIEQRCVLPGRNHRARHAQNLVSFVAGKKLNKLKGCVLVGAVRVDHIREAVY